MSVLVIDEAPKPGGQIYRQLPAAFRPTDAAILGRDFQRGQQLLAETTGLPIRFIGGTTVWGSFAPRVLEVTTEERAWQISAQAIVLATGAYDRAVPIPGWTLPGVLTVGGAQTLIKSQRIRPGRRVLLAGTGPLLLVVASQMAKSGVEIVAVADPVPMRALIPHTPALLRGWRLMKDGVGYKLTLAKACVPWIAPAILTRIEGDGEVERATIATVDRDWRPVRGTEQTFEVDTVCMGYGLLPSIELLRVLGCEVRYHDEADAWLPERTIDGETSVPRIFAVGDGAMVAGAMVAAEEGRIAGLAVARLLGRLSHDQADGAMIAPRKRLAALAPFRRAMDRVYQVRPGLYELAAPDTLICRCEEIRRRELTDALTDGACSLSQAKAWTRAGMGNCQARICGMAMAHLMVGADRAALATLEWFTPRPPVRPVAIEALLSDGLGP